MVARPLRLNLVALDRTHDTRGILFRPPREPALPCMMSSNTLLVAWPKHRSSVNHRFDENMGPRLVHALEPEYPGSAHVRALGLRAVVWQHRHGGYLALPAKSPRVAEAAPTRGLQDDRVR